ncbi:MAG TPA: tyrosine--tRNA ligase, partial [Alphaproteobacteria bacterium]|nr:tyrosine--tRNA ligase [Alphaproteobacteria bacterium]
EKLSSYDYFQYFRNIGDAEVAKCLAIFTDLPMDEVRRLSALKDQEINEAKKVLAYEATKMCRGKVAADEALETAVKTFEQGMSGDNLPVLEADLQAGISVLDAFLNIGFVSSKGEARRLIKQAGLKINDKAVTDENYIITAKDIENGEVKLSQGKKKHGLIKA